MNIKLNKNKTVTIKNYIIILEQMNHKNIIIYLITIVIKLNLLDLVILIIATKNKNSNIFLHILDSFGNQLAFYSIGLINLNKKYNQKLEILQYYTQTIFNKLNLLNTKPTIIHLLNMNYNLNWFFHQLIKKIGLITINLMYNFAYNGCRRKKLIS